MIRQLRFLGFLLCAGIGCAASGCGANGGRDVVPVKAVNALPAANCEFEEIAGRLGIEFTYHNGGEADLCTILESLGGGVGWFDFDRDGCLDLAATGGGRFSANKQITGLPSAVFRSDEGKRFRNVTARAYLASSSLYTNGLAVADYDQDGFQDLLITGYGAPQLWKNLGDGTFVELAQAAGLTDPRWGSSAGWADLNGDGQLDLYLAHYVNWSFENDPICPADTLGKREICPPRSFDPVPHSVHYSQGDGSFLDASTSAGLRPDGKGLGVLLSDVDLDGDVDIYVGNDTTDNFLYLNDGRGVFEEIGLSHGVALDDLGSPNGSMGVELCDFNLDGRPDIWVTNYQRESNALYRNEGRGYFLHVSQRMGITDLGDLFVGFGTACADFDSDGDQDFVVANGHVLRYPHPSTRKQMPLLIANHGRRFDRVAAQPGNYFAQLHEGRGLAAADYDADGDLDLAISHIGQPLAILENRFHDANRWLSLTLVGTRSNRDAIGARLDLVQGEKKLHRQITGGGSYLSHSSRAIHFALPSGAAFGKLVIHWPAGLVQTVEAGELAGSVTLIEPLTEGESSPRVVSSQVQP